MSHQMTDDMKMKIASEFFSSPFLYSRGQFHQRFLRAFFVRKFVQSQNVTRKKTFVRKIRAFNVDEIDSRCAKETSTFVNFAVDTLSTTFISHLCRFFKKA